MRNVKILMKICFLSTLALIFMATLSFGQQSSKVRKMALKKDNFVKCKDIDCFIEAAKDYRKATYTHFDSFDFGEIILYKDDYYKIKSGTSAKCVLYTKVLRWEGVPNEKYLAELKKRGKKPAEYDKESRATSEKRMRDMVGKDGVCTFSAEKLTALLKRWKNERYSTSDLKGSKCLGSYFVPENGFPKGF